jgi:hypothetical protein
MKALYESLGVSKRIIDDSKGIRENNVFTKYSDSAPTHPNYNLMMDLLELPTASQGYKYLLVAVDLCGNKHFDIEPLKMKTAPACLKGMKKIFSRRYIHKPYFSIVTDAGSEFKGVFDRFCEEQGIYHKVTIPKRKTQNANVESLNRLLVRLIFAYLNQQEVEKKKVVKNWLPIVPILRERLNQIRGKNVEPLTLDNYPALDLIAQPKFKVGQAVQYSLNEPRTFLGNKNTGNFREGDKRWSEPTTIKSVFFYAGQIPFRYLVESNQLASYTESQLRRYRA